MQLCGIPAASKFRRSPMTTVKPGPAELNRSSSKFRYRPMTTLSAIRVFAVLCLTAAPCAPALAQFHDTFDGSELDGWTFFTGAGEATMDFVPAGGFASIRVDATRDRRNVWYAVIKRDVSSGIDLDRLQEDGKELRVEARIRSSHAPRRVNLHVNTQRTTDFHSHLMEFDIPDTTSWHTISMTTDGFDARPGDTVNAQLALMDWGLGTYRVDVDYYRVDVVDRSTAPPDVGEPLQYRPAMPPPESFEHVVQVTQDAVIDLQFPDVNLGSWYMSDSDERLLSVTGSQWVILRWDLSAFAGRQVKDHGILELTTYSVQRAALDIPDFGMMRVSEILEGEAQWDRRTVTLNNLRKSVPLDNVVNTQMIVDVDVAEARGSRTLVTISRPVLQRLVDGATRGLVLQPLGAINASFYAGDAEAEERSPRLRFSTW
jgi:hypothetical protein